MTKLKKQFWFYGVIPILIIYILDIHFFGTNIILSFDDCLPNQSCSDFFLKELNRSRNFSYTLSLILFMWTFWNSFRIFQLSKTEITFTTKMIVRSSVILFPIIAMILFPFLALENGRTPSLFINLYYDLWVLLLQFLGGSHGKFGMGYYIANILIFVIIQPSLIILFFIFWRKQRKKNIISELQNKSKEQT